MHFQILIDDVIDVTSIAESDFYDLLVERDFPIILSGGASIAFIPTIDEAIDADLT
jgi:predicted DNA-binding transcriptional regulator AlpA